MKTNAEKIDILHANAGRILTEQERTRIYEQVRSLMLKRDARAKFSDTDEYVQVLGQTALNKAMHYYHIITPQAYSEANKPLEDALFNDANEDYIFKVTALLNEDAAFLDAMRKKKHGCRWWGGVLIVLWGIAAFLVFIYLLGVLQ